MQRTLSRSIFVFALVAGAAFVALGANTLPPVVAAHFAASGQANGFMQRPNYLAFMLIFITGFPALVVTSISAVYRGSGERMNLPNGDWWLAPQRRDATVAFLVAHAQWLGVLLVVFPVPGAPPGAAGQRGAAAAAFRLDADRHRGAVRADDGAMVRRPDAAAAPAPSFEPDLKPLQPGLMIVCSASFLFS